MIYSFFAKVGTALAILIAGLFCICFRFVERQYFDFSAVSPERKGLRILVLHRNGTGEKEAISRMKIACQRLGWECYACSSNPSFWKRFFLRRPIDRVFEAVQPDFTLNFQCKERFVPGINFVSLASGAHLYFGEEGKLDVGKLACFDGFLPTFQEVDLLKARLEERGIPFRGMVWLFTVPAQEYRQVEPQKLFYCGSNWDKTRKGLEYQRLFSLLDERDDVEFYGPKGSWKFLKKCYQGSIPFDGTSLMDRMQRAGIALILHSDSHIQGNSPTGRIFEAAAASCVIISDLHPFVQKEFGESVLYIDQTQSAESMGQQIAAHLEWIRAHPNEAKEKAKRAHQIFAERFTLEKQMGQLKGLYEELF